MSALSVDVHQLLREAFEQFDWNVLIEQFFELIRLEILGYISDELNSRSCTIRHKYFLCWA